MIIFQFELTLKLYSGVRIVAYSRALTVLGAAARAVAVTDIYYGNSLDG